MKIRLDENKYIVAYAVVGDVENSIEADLSVEDFNNLPCFLYKYENGLLTLDEEKKKQWEGYEAYRRTMAELNGVQHIPGQINMFE